MNTGWKRYQNLIEVYEDNGEPTGNIKPNVDTDDYFASDVWDPGVCPCVGCICSPPSGTTELPGVFSLRCGVSSGDFGGILSVSSTNLQNNFGSANLAPGVYSTMEYLEGTVVTITAIENIGYDFLEFQGSSGITNGNTIVLTMDSDKNVSAFFKPEQRRVTVLGGGGGVILRIGTITRDWSNGHFSLVAGMDSRWEPGTYNFDYNTIITIIGSFVDSNMATCGTANQTSGGCAVISGHYDKAFFNNSLFAQNTQIPLTNNIILKGALVCDTTNCS